MELNLLLKENIDLDPDKFILQYNKSINFKNLAIVILKYNLYKNSYHALRTENLSNFTLRVIPIIIKT